MKIKLLILAALSCVLVTAASAQVADKDHTWSTPGNTTVGNSGVQLCPNASGFAVPCNTVASAGATNAGYPSGATPITASATGTTGAITATLAAASGKTTYICGFSFYGTNATAANTTTNITVTNTITGTLNYGFATLAAAATVPNNPTVTVPFTPCVPASAVNTTIVVNGPALGAGATLVTASAWGYQF